MGVDNIRARMRRRSEGKGAQEWCLDRRAGLVLKGGLACVHSERAWGENEGQRRGGCCRSREEQAAAEDLRG